MVDGREDEKGARPEELSFGAIMAVAASVITVLGFLGFSNFTQVREFLAPSGPTSSAPTAAGETTTTEDETTTASEETTSPDSSEPEPDDPADLDDSASDPTPFTASALLASGFTTDQGTEYALVSSGGKPCGQSAGMSPDVRAALDAYGCSAAMVGVYLVDSDTASADEQVLVSVQVMPLSSATAVEGVRANLAEGGSWDFGIWCPGSGVAEQTCSGDYASAVKAGRVSSDHRYLIGVSAVYANLNSASTSRPWVTAAARAATRASGPDNAG
ncbi:hypothetical protein ACL03H_18185 [Saccharopolyspora sp. MS10]|uniref:hypothetical protein n=1 Tax=Saccharopolyspora sp. MS10 TaxID=3385973 RepID=UPI0039A2111F